MEDTKLPTFLELAENKLKYASSKDKIINIKISINTARMMLENEKNPPVGLRYGLSEERMEEIRDAIKIVIGGMVAKQVPSYKAVTSLCVLFRLFYDNPNYEKTPEQVVLGIIEKGRNE